LWAISGIQVSQKTIHLQIVNFSVDLDVKEHLVAGAYFLKVENGSGSIGYFKLIKE
jgi:hypothetical protein